jgi:hypothetical protein
MRACGTAVYVCVTVYTYDRICSVYARSICGSLLADKRDARKVFSEWWNRVFTTIKFPREVRGVVYVHTI